MGFCRKGLCVLLLILSACSPHTPQEFQKESEALCYSLLDILKELQTREQLLSQEVAIKRKFEEIAYLMMEASTAREENPDEWALAHPSLENFAAENLKLEMQRIYSLEGGREILERAQREALVRLDSHERVRLKRQQKSPY